MIPASAELCGGHYFQCFGRQAAALLAAGITAAGVLQQALTRIFHTLIAAFRESAVPHDRDESGALTRRRYGMLAVHAECENSRLRMA